MKPFAQENTNQENKKRRKRTVTFMQKKTIKTINKRSNYTDFVLLTFIMQSVKFN